jgi:hypothetical protein
MRSPSRHPVPGARHARRRREKVRRGAEEGSVGIGRQGRCRRARQHPAVADLPHLPALVIDATARGGGMVAGAKWPPPSDDAYAAPFTVTSSRPATTATSLTRRPAKASGCHHPDPEVAPADGDTMSANVPAVAAPATTRSARRRRSVAIEPRDAADGDGDVGDRVDDDRGPQ